MSRKPFNVSAPAAANPGEPSKPRALNPAAAQDKSDAEGITLTEAGAEVMTADGETGGLQEAPADPGGRPVYAPSIPWPAAKNGHKPYKV